ncbi:MAG: L-ribulose-5-phosphate 4-epimerase AraD [Planctomycetia bacterium]|nr:L-ribulose-5-phosphate 4-epimerase AraD [Planctomycetia bacterium]
MNLQQLRESVCEANLELNRQGLVTLTWGNVGELTEDGDAFLIKPSGVPYGEMRPADMVLVSLTGKVLEGTNRPSSDTPTYIELYRYFLKLQKSLPGFVLQRGIVHTHSTCAVAWAQARREIPCLGTTHADHFYGSVPVTRPLSPEEVQEGYEKNTGYVIIERFKTGRLNPMEVPGVLVAGHGPFSWGKSGGEAVKNAVALEAVAQMARDTFLISASAPALEEYVRDKHYYRKHGPNAYYGQKKEGE